MRRNSISAVLVLAIVLTTVFVFSHGATAGQFKRLNTETLAVGAQISAHASPLNTGAAMEMDTYEFKTAAAGGSYRGRILTNSTGQTLNLKVIGTNGLIVASCSAVNAGTCNTATLSLVGNLLFLVIIATQNGAPVNAGAHYSMAVQRQ
jgi:hypothetical protein